jgi:hypothetical protein
VGVEDRISIEYHRRSKFHEYQDLKKKYLIMGLIFPQQKKTPWLQQASPTGM